MSASGETVERIALALDADHKANGFTLGVVERGEHRRMAALVLDALSTADLLTFVREAHDKAEATTDESWERRTPWRCRHGWHDWRFVSMSDHRTVDVVGHPLHHICRLVERCERCRLRRTRDHADVPKRPKMSGHSGSSVEAGR